jgi:predicted trehalose synthase
LLILRSIVELVIIAKKQMPPADKAAIDILLATIKAASKTQAAEAGAAVAKKKAIGEPLVEVNALLASSPDLAKALAEATGKAQALGKEVTSKLSEMHAHLEEIARKM